MAAAHTRQTRSSQPIYLEEGYQPGQEQAFVESQPYVPSTYPAEEDDSDDQHSAYSLAQRHYQPPTQRPILDPSTSQNVRQIQPVNRRAAIPILQQLAQATGRSQANIQSQAGTRSSPHIHTGYASSPPTTPIAKPPPTPTPAKNSADRQPAFSAREDRILTDVLLNVVMEGAAPDNNFKGSPTKWLPIQSIKTSLGVRETSRT
jgi:hypothetical protein